jgi:7-carboxy-7-deazaguanine synthase
MPAGCEQKGLPLTLPSPLKGERVKVRGEFHMKAKISEIFGSIQGEGIYAGTEQLFVRFSGCNISCSFCDESAKKEFNEYTAAETAELILKEKMKTVSLTGGEPLLQSGFLKEMLPLLKADKLKIYLETNGILTDNLLEIRDYVDIISMDIKLPSSAGVKPFWKEHADFLKEAVKKETFVKAVVTPDTVLSDIETAAAIVSGTDKNIPFIIQPVSYNDNIADIKDLGLFFGAAGKRLNDVRIIPQIHKILKLR